MTDMIAQDLQDMTKHKGRTLAAAITTLAIPFLCCAGAYFFVTGF